MPLFDMNHSSVNARLARDLDNLSYYEKRRHDFDATSAKSRFFHHALQAQHYATFGRIVWRYLPHSTRGNLPSTFKTTSITIMNNAARPVQVLLALSAVVPVLCKQHMLYREGTRITSAIKVAQEDRDNVSTPQATDNLDTNPGLRESLVEILQNLQYFLLRQVVFTGPRTDTNSEDAVGWLLDQNVGDRMRIELLSRALFCWPEEDFQVSAPILQRFVAEHREYLRHYGSTPFWQS